MSTIKSLIFIKNAVETLGYFSEELSIAFEEMGYKCYFIDYEDLFLSIRIIKEAVKQDNCALITFNFIGLSGEKYAIEDNNNTIWENYNVPCFCILVDHPLYYYNQLAESHKNLHIYCVDRFHMKYMHRFYSQYNTQFLPLAGNILFNEKELIPYEKRKYDITFIANYVPIENLLVHINGVEREYVDFYQEIIEYLISNPDTSLEDALMSFVLREVGTATDNELREAFAGMLFIDLCIRTHFRGETVKNLVDAGIKVHVFGKDWDKLACKCPENLIISGNEVDSAACVKAIRNTKIALNTMPWFKDGAHDRIFTAMLNGAVSLTDSSIYLNQEINTECAVFYDIKELDKFPDKVNYLLMHEERAKQIAECGYNLSRDKHMWKNRAKVIEKNINVSN